MDFFDDAPPSPDGVAFVEEELSMAWDGSPFLLQNAPGLLCRVGELNGVWVFGSAFWTEVGSLV